MTAQPNAAPITALRLRPDIGIDGWLEDASRQLLRGLASAGMQNTRCQVEEQLQQADDAMTLQILRRYAIIELPDNVLQAAAGSCRHQPWRPLGGPGHTNAYTRPLAQRMVKRWTAAVDEQRVAITPVVVGQTVCLPRRGPRDGTVVDRFCLESGEAIEGIETLWVDDDLSYAQVWGGHLVLNGRSDCYHLIDPATGESTTVKLPSVPFTQFTVGEGGVGYLSANAQSGFAAFEIATGKILWYNREAKSMGGRVSLADGVLAAYTENAGTLVLLDQATGEPRGMRRITDKVPDVASLNANLACHDGGVTAFNKLGLRRAPLNFLGAKSARDVAPDWQRELPEPADRCYTIASGPEMILMGSDSGRVRAFDLRNGHIRWGRDGKIGGIYGTALFPNAGMAWGQSGIFAFDLSPGKHDLWRYPTEDIVVTPPAILPNGDILYIERGGTLVCLTAA